MTPDWTPLERELARWEGDGLTLPLWWRDDDAIQPTLQLDRLTDLSDECRLPVHLAVIPQAAQDDLAGYLADNPNLIPVVHGWAHRNHAPEGEKKAEFRLHRPTSEMAADAGRGLKHLRALIGPDLRPMFVPPWNRIAPGVVELLPALGYRTLSTSTPRKTRNPIPGLEQVNTHLDPIDWRGSRGLADPDTLIAQLVALLTARRSGAADNTEPFGLLTHHLVHDQDIWTFTRDLIGRLMRGPVRVWTAPRG